MLQYWPDCSLCLSDEKTEDQSGFRDYILTVCTYINSQRHVHRIFCLYVYYVFFSYNDDTYEAYFSIGLQGLEEGNVVEVNRLISSTFKEAIQ